MLMNENIMNTMKSQQCMMSDVNMKWTNKRESVEEIQIISFTKKNGYCPWEQLNKWHMLKTIYLHIHIF